MISNRNILLYSKNIAIVRTDRLGDMILTLPLALALKKRLPNANISMIARTYTKPLLFKSPALDNYFFIDEFKNGLKDIFKYNKFDTVFFPHPVFNEAFDAYQAGIRLRIGSGFRFYSLLYNCRIWEHRKESVKHEAEYNVNMLASVLKESIETELPGLYVKPTAIQNVIEKLSSLGIEGNYIIIHPGSGGSANDWGAENFGELAKEISDKYDLKILVTGIESEFDKCKIVCDKSEKAINLCGQFDLDGMIGLISKSKMLIANSTGVLHLASALKIPVLGLYPNSPHLSQKRWGPYSSNSVVINAPASEDINQRDDMTLIKVKDVMAGFEGLM